MSARGHSHPRLKPIYPVYHEAPHQIIFGAQLGLTQSIEDPEDQVWQVVQMCDGQHSESEILAALNESFPAVTARDLSELLELLDGFGYLCPEGGRDPRAERPTIRDRYVGNLNYFLHFQSRDDIAGAAQGRLTDAAVLLLGVGGGGSIILQLLCGLGLRRITVVDGDDVELSNLNRQLIFSEADLGRPKVAAAQRFARERAGRTTISAVNEYVSTARRVAELAEGHDLIICAADKPPDLIQRVVSAGAVRAGVPVVYGASQVSRGRVLSIVPGRSGCIDCLFLHYNDEDPGWAERFRALGAFGFSPPTMAYGPAMMRISAEVADEAVRLLSGYTAPRTVGRQWELDYVTGSAAELLSWPRREDCPSCGTGDLAAWRALLGEAEDHRFDV